MNDLLHNPVYNALCTGDKELSFGTELVKYFDAEVSPYAGFKDDYENGFTDLCDMLPEGRRILFAHPTAVDIPNGWQLQHEIKGLQFVYTGNKTMEGNFTQIVPLATEHVSEMIELVRLTKPGPFDKRTIEFGSYHGIFVDGQLAAITGQRLHVGNYTELSAVCTHPNHLGKGFATLLMQHQMQIILQSGKIPFLHVREDNARAIAVYERLGFEVSRPMYFYFIKRQ